MLQRTPQSPDPAWLDRLYAKEFDALVHYAYRIVGNVSQAEDIVQETFALLIANPPKEFGKIAGWLRTVVRHRAIDQLRGLKREQSRLGPREDCATVLSAEEHALTTIDRQKVQEALNKLSTRDAKALWLRHSGFRYQEIAKIIDIPENQVGVLLLRAMNKFRTHYSDTQQPEENSTPAHKEAKNHVKPLSGRQSVAAPNRSRH